MERKIAVIGGDLRLKYLANMLVQENTVITYGQELENDVKLEAMKIDNLQNAIELSDIIICPIPFSKDGKNVYSLFSSKKIPIDELMKHSKNKMLITGSISNENVIQGEKNNIKVIDIMKDESLAVLNTIATAEGTIEIAINKSKKTIQGSKVLILGYGRVAKVVALKFSALSADVTCAVRKPEAFAWIEVNGYKSVNINEIGENLSEYDIIINTPPTMILTKERLKYVKRNCLVIDLASYPGGVDFEIAKELGINYEWALGLPGKVAPITAAEHIKKTLDTILKNNKDI